MTKECCSHSIVALTKLFVGGVAVKDVWACCDCGARFEHAPSLPVFEPEPSHLHAKIERLRAEVAEYERWQREMVADYRLIADNHRVSRQGAINGLIHKLRSETESRAMFVARLERIQSEGEKWLTIASVLNLLNDCDMVVSRAALTAKDKP